MIKDQTFAEATCDHGDSSLFTSGKIGGLLGMAFDDLAVDKVTTVFTNLVTQQHMKNVFSFYLNRYVLFLSFREP